MKTTGMLVEDERVLGLLEKIASSLTPERAWQQDLVQEARLHLWLLERQRPGQSTSWYLQSCRFRMQHCLAAGKSLDSRKRRANQLLLVVDSHEPSKLLEELQATNPEFEEASTRDIVMVLSVSLRPRERDVLNCLADGLPTTDIARRLRLSSPTVTKYRRKIARLVVKFGIALPAKRENRQIAGGTRLQTA